MGKRSSGAMIRLRPNLHGIVDALVMTAIFAFLLTYFEPHLLLSKTITTGGDTASHYYSAQYLRDELLPKGEIIGWVQGNYAGFPLFQFYFPLPFLMMAGLSWIIPLQIAFKWVSVLGVFLLPLLTYLMLRLLRFGFPVPIFGALATLPFLFMEANSMWGANLPSTLAGEFAYSLGFALTVLFIGTLFRGVHSGGHVVGNAVLVALIGFSHGYTLLFAGFISAFFLITTERFFGKLWYLMKIYGLGFFLMGIWIIPLLANLPNTTRYNHVWFITGFLEVFPWVLLPLIAAGLVGRGIGIGWFLFRIFLRPFDGGDGPKPFWDRLADLSSRFDERILFLWFAVAVGGAFYWVGNKIHVVDIRFLPFVQLLLVVIGGVEVARWLKRFSFQWSFPVILALGVFLWVDYHSVSIKSWITWNYSGFETKPQWPIYSEINRYLAGTPADPRVVYENSESYNDMGTLRAFESLPLFSGRSTLEGLYMQGSLSTPFIFYIQSEISKDISCPLSDYGCTTINMKNAVTHLKMFNVREIITRTDEVKKAIRAEPEFAFLKSFGTIDLFRLTTNDDHYVVPLKFEPVLFETEDWKIASYRWFKKVEINDIHLVFPQEISTNDRKRFKAEVADGRLDALPRIPIPGDCRVEDEVRNEEVIIHTDCLHRPLLVKISYHPNWRAEGADSIYLVSPSFMLIYPEKETVILRYSNTPVERVGFWMSVAGLGAAFLNFPLWRENRFRRSAARLAASTERAIYRTPFIRGPAAFIAVRRMQVLAASVGLSLFLFVLFVFLVQKEDQNTLLASGMKHYNREDFDAARSIFQRVIQKYPITGAANDSGYYLAITYFKEMRYEESIEAFRRLISDNPESNWVPEAAYHIGLSYDALKKDREAREAFQTVVARYPASDWSKHAAARLADMAGRGPGEDQRPDELYGRAMAYFDSGELEKARTIFGRVLNEFPKTKWGEYSGYFYAICLYKENRFEEVIREFDTFARRYPKSDYTPEAYYHIALSWRTLKNEKKADEYFRRVIRDYPDSRWASFSKEALKTGKS